MTTSGRRRPKGQAEGLVFEPDLPTQQNTTVPV